MLSVLIIEGMGDFRCKHCNKAYTRLGNMRRHERYECLGSLPRFRCSICSHTSRRKHDLQRHIFCKHYKFF
ncbi:hypothetical protein O3M35_011158 [Rhynocoris fuscipes]|uniref:C2H2-type domain-containing protein n=1 Tax=Rhynocoris fuscipes TaxID=488301 RepID=A0AAW1CWJ1_9HEMI